MATWIITYQHFYILLGCDHLLRGKSCAPVPQCKRLVRRKWVLFKKKMIPMFNFLFFCIIYYIKLKPDAIVSRNGCRRPINTTDRTSVMAQWNFVNGLFCSQGPFFKKKRNFLLRRAFHFRFELINIKNSELYLFNSRSITKEDSLVGRVMVNRSILS